MNHFSHINIILIVFIDYTDKRITQSVEENSILPVLECPKCPDVSCPACPSVNINNKTPVIPTKEILKKSIIQQVKLPEDDLTLFDASPAQILKYKAISSKDILVQKIFNIVSIVSHPDISRSEYDKHTLGKQNILNKFFQYYQFPEIFYAHEMAANQVGNLDISQDSYFQAKKEGNPSLVVPIQKNNQEMVFYQTKDGIHQRLSMPIKKTINNDMKPRKDKERKILLDICRDPKNYRIRYYTNLNITPHQNKLKNMSYHDKKILQRYKSSSPHIIIHIKGIKSPFIYQDKWYWILEQLPMGNEISIH